MGFILLSLATLLIILLPVFFFRKKKKARPVNKIDEWGIHYTDNSSFSRNEIQQLTESFLDSWLEVYPDHKKKLLLALQNLNIIWHSKRIRFNENFVLALMENPETIHLWIGPLLKDGTRKLAYTGYLDQLGKLTLLVNNLEPDTTSPVNRKILTAARQKILN